MTPAGGLEFVAGQLEPLPQRVAEIDRVHKTTIDLARMFDAALVEPFGYLRKAARETLKAIWWTLPMPSGLGVGSTSRGLIGEDGDQAAIAGIEVQVALVGIIQVRLLEDKGHTQDAFPKVDRDLPVGPDKRNMVYPLGLNLVQGFSFSLMLINTTTPREKLLRSEPRR